MDRTRRPRSASSGCDWTNGPQGPGEVVWSCRNQVCSEISSRRWAEHRGLSDSAEGDAIDATGSGVVLERFNRPVGGACDPGGAVGGVAPGFTAFVVDFREATDITRDLFGVVEAEGSGHVGCQCVRRQAIGQGQPAEYRAVVGQLHDKSRVTDFNQSSESEGGRRRKRRRLARVPVEDVVERRYVLVGEAGDWVQPWGSE